MNDKWPIGVFASIDAGLGVRLEVAHELGVPTIHLHTPHVGSRTPQRAAEFSKRLAELGIRTTCVFAGFEGESYADIPTVNMTVGLVPRETRAARTAELKAIADFARTLNVDVVGVHLGFVPHDSSDRDYRQLLDLTRDVCDHCKRNRQALHLETGQEPVDVLIQFLNDVGRDNLFVNFDPANMILYGAGEPLPALEALGSRVRSVHCKDATWSDRPGETWGREVPLGEGDVDFAAFLKTLKRIGYDGPLTIEREIPQEPERQKAEIGGAIELLQRLKSKM
ncbi:MAG: sugar phosphate isomerase/epimerase [Planctomycetes bacterium]|nr:sugar phosphate isomerase/epimerase [Planctomycetota bacterium]